jgi:hypothetical protein
VIWLIDDGHLARALASGKLPSVVRRSDKVFTTGYWYVRLCGAAFGADDRTGALSRRFAQLPAALRLAARERVAALPPEIGLLSLRQLGPAIGRLRSVHSLNALSSEALAAAIALEARVLLSVASPSLEAALAAEGRRCVVRAVA